MANFKRFTCNLIVLMICGMFSCISVVCTGLNVNVTGSRRGIYKNVPTRFVVVIPEGKFIKYKANSTNIGEVAIIQKTFKTGSFVSVSVSNPGVLTNTSNSMCTVPFALNNLSDNTKFTGCRFYGDNISPSSYPLKIDVSDEDWNKAESGKYRVTINFNISYNENTFKDELLN